MLKSIADISKLVARRFDRCFASAVVAEARAIELLPGVAWPHSIALGRLGKRELVEGIDELVEYTARIVAFAEAHNLDLRFDTRVAGGRQKVPTHVVVPHIDAAASVAGRAAYSTLKRARGRAAVLVDAFPACDDITLAHVISRCAGADDVDFDLLVQAALWFSCNDATGLTPRQVPLEGFHAKWLDNAGRKTLISLLCGKDDLGLEERPARVDFAYLDPAYLVGGGRRYDSYVVGDLFALPYEPRVVVIVENKDTYLRFPQLEAGICVFGNGGAGAGHVRLLPWIGSVEHLFYWGDMDADGFAILNGYREGGLDVSSVLMDMDSYRRYERFGTSRAAGKQRLSERKERDLAFLTSDERELYELLVNPDCPTARRIEQERIPLDHALTALGNV